MKQLIHNLPSVLCAVALAAFFGESQARSAELTHSDKSFITDATEGGFTEVQMGDLVKTKGQSAAVKELGEMLVTDHTKANNELKKIAEGKGVEVPSGPGLVQKAKLKLLEQKEGAAFDKAFAEDAVEDHKKDIKAFEKASKDLTDPDLKAFASKTLPTLRKHLEHAEKAQPK